ncbi:MAG: hypothetical protein ABW220_11945 [Burkholderiaceae bacterium]
MNNTWVLRGATLLAVLALTACGGGGGGGGGGGFVPLPVVTNPAPDSGAAVVTVSGVATYDAVPNATGALAYDSLTAKPVRGAVVEVLNSTAAVVATTATDGNGAYSVSVPANTQVTLRVKAQLLQGGSGANWDVSVRDNTQSDALYVIDSPAFSSGAAASTRDLRATSGWGGSSYTGQRIAAPFAILDTLYTAMQKVLAVAPGTTFPALKVFWSINNVPAGGTPAIGQIGTTSFVNSSANGLAIYVLGKENVDTDEYDASVIAHEWGHYYQSAFSRDDSPGGDHAAGQRVDRRLAFSEGWGNAWSGIALARSNYTDSTGAGQAQGLNLNLATGPATGPGWFRESSIQAIFWNLNQQLGFQPIHAAMTGAFRTSVAVTSIHSFAAGFNAASPGSASALNALLAAQSISAAPNDPFGTAETNNGGLPSALPMYATAAIGGTTNACVSNSAGPGNKLGSFAYLRVSAPTPGNRQIVVSGPAGSDPDFEVYSGRLLASSDGLGVSESASVGLLAGDNVVVVNDYNNSGASTCFTVTIN